MPLKTAQILGHWLKLVPVAQRVLFLKLRPATLSFGLDFSFFAKIVKEPKKSSARRSVQNSSISKTKSVRIKGKYEFNSYKRFLRFILPIFCDKLDKLHLMNYLFTIIFLDATKSSVFTW